MVEEKNDFVQKINPPLDNFSGSETMAVAAFAAGRRSAWPEKAPVTTSRGVVALCVVSFSQFLSIIFFIEILLSCLILY
jgi:hypothetical protein